jgi:hypothetical protein
VKEECENVEILEKGSYFQNGVDFSFHFPVRTYEEGAARSRLATSVSELPILDEKSAV